MHSKNWKNGGVEIILTITSNQQVYHQLEQQSDGATGAYQWQLYPQYPENCIMSRTIRSQVATQKIRKKLSLQANKENLHQSYLKFQEWQLSFHQQPSEYNQF